VHFKTRPIVQPEVIGVNMRAPFPYGKNAIRHLIFQRLPAGEAFVLNRQVNVISVTATETGKEYK
ncbi:MAG TPA: hypothetical protein VIQ51_01035, partial [Chryseosolibacter sp.]